MVPNPESVVEPADFIPEANKILESLRKLLAITEQKERMYQQALPTQDSGSKVSVALVQEVIGKMEKIVAILNKTKVLETTEDKNVVEKAKDILRDNPIIEPKAATEIERNEGPSLGQ
ncbi:MAG: hypothetical protein WC627_06260 [Legionella sp.]|jgi:hypothetical protein